MPFHPGDKAIILNARATIFKVGDIVEVVYSSRGLTTVRMNRIAQVLADDEI